jgi:hypothetical protein
MVVEVVELVVVVGTGNWVTGGEVTSGTVTIGGAGAVVAVVVGAGREVVVDRAAVVGGAVVGEAVEAGAVLEGTVGGGVVGDVPAVVATVDAPPCALAREGPKGTPAKTHSTSAVAGRPRTANSNVFPIRPTVTVWSPGRFAECHRPLTGRACPRKAGARRRLQGR